MRIHLLLLAALFFLFPFAVADLSYQETDRIALNVSTFDPDSDELRVTYSSPLNAKGEWQTTYGDAGVYAINVTVSDGTLSSSEEVIVVVNRKDEPPQIISQHPRRGIISLREGKSLSFSSAASDKNKDALSYAWNLDGRNVSTNQRFVYSPGYDDSGNHSLSLHITDGSLTTSKSWDIIVRDVDLDALVMAQYADFSVRENEIARIALPDFAYYGIKYDISSPLQNGYWKTNFNSSGTYKITIHVFGKGYDKSKTIRLKVENVDQKPRLDQVSARSGNEGEELSFAIIANDPDNDKIALTLKNAPEGSSFSNGTFRWTPPFDTVEHTGFSTALSRGLHLLSKSLELEFVATANNQSAVMKVPVTIFNTNRAPVLSEHEALIVHEGDIFEFDANATDPDRDPLRFIYQSTLDRGSMIGYDSAGSHAMKVIVTDGFLQDEMTIPITVENTNRAPTLEVSSFKIRENQSFSATLKGRDDDNDPLTYTLIDGPKGVTLAGSTLAWTPGFDVASLGSHIAFASVRVSDGSLESMQNLSIEVRNVNRAPAFPSYEAMQLSAQRGKPITFQLNATDPDNDALSYTWKFGWFDSYRGGDSHTRTFVTKGKKTIVVKVTDGEETIKKKIIVNVL
jgi:PKD repeat protein